MPYRFQRPLVMLLAGLPASGKTTLLHESLRDRKALFGDDLAAAFLRTHPLPEGPGDRLTIEQRMQIGSWINEGDLLRLHLRKERPAKLVVHFDLLWFLRIASSWRRGDGADFTLQGFADFLQDGDAVTEVFRDVLGLHPVLGSRTVIRVVKPSYAIACERSHGRMISMDHPDMKPWNEFQRRHLYNRRPSGEELYERLYANWHQAISETAVSFG